VTQNCGGSPAVRTCRAQGTAGAGLSADRPEDAAPSRGRTLRRPRGARSASHARRHPAAGRHAAHRSSPSPTTAEYAAVEGEGDRSCPGSQAARSWEGPFVAVDHIMATVAGHRACVGCTPSGKSLDVFRSTAAGTTPGSGTAPFPVSSAHRPGVGRRGRAAGLRKQCCHGPDRLRGAIPQFRPLPGLSLGADAG
jgi:hypothetical protein